MEKASILSLREWFRKCEFIDSRDPFRINFLGDRPTVYSIDESPTDPIIKYYYGGTKRIKNYVLASREFYSDDVLNAAAVSKNYEDLEKWIETQNKRRVYPNLGSDKQVTRVELTLSPMIYETSTDTARYQIQLEVEYLQSEIK